MTSSRSAFLVLFAFSSLRIAAATIGGSVTPGGMTVSAYTSAGAFAAATTAAANGSYSLNVDAGLYRVLAYDPAGFYATSFHDAAESFETSKVLDVQTSVSSIDMTLVQAGFIAGSITASAAPRGNVTVAAYNASGTRRGFTTSAADGTYRLVLPPGTYRLAAYDDGGELATSFYSGQSTFAGATAIAVSAGATASADFALVPAARIRGVARDAVTTAALANIRVTAYAASGVVAGAKNTDAAGAYEHVLSPGTYRLVFDDVAAGLHASVYWPGAESFETATPLSVVSGETVTAGAALARGGRLEGVVRDAATSAPLPNVSAAAFNANGSMRTETTTDAQGRYSLLVPPGTYRAGAFDRALMFATMFHAQQPRFDAATPVAVTGGQTAGALDLSLPRAARLGGTVHDAFGFGLSGIIVGAFDAAGALAVSATSTANGAYAFAVPAGVYRIVAFDPALRYVTSAHGTVVVAAGDAVSADFTMFLGGAATGLVRAAASGSPVEGITVSAYDAAGTEIATATTDAAGRYALTMLAGTYRFSASDPLHRYAPSFHDNAVSYDLAHSVTIPTGSVAAIDFALVTNGLATRRRAVRK